MKTQTRISRRPPGRHGPLRVWLFLVCGMAVAGCAGSGSPGVASSGPYNVLTTEQLRQTTTSNPYDAIRRLRPQWLRARGRTSIVGGGPDEPTVYVEGTRLASLRDLQQMDLAQVRRIEFVEPIEATTRFGTGHTGGAILVELGGA